MFHSARICASVVILWCRKRQAYDMGVYDDSASGASQQTRITITMFCWVNLIILFSEGADIFDMFDELFSEMGGAGGFRRVSL